MINTIPQKTFPKKTVLKYIFAFSKFFLWYSKAIYLEAYEFSAVVAITAYDANALDRDTKPNASTPMFSVTKAVKKKLIK